MYKVIKAFTDLHDNDYPYSVGDVFPRLGVKVSKKRIEELAGSSNKQGTPLIRETADPVAEAIRKGAETQEAK